MRSGAGGDEDMKARKQRTGSECKKKKCKRYKLYKAWACYSSELMVCMNCKWSHVSQYEKEQSQ